MLFIFSKLKIFASSAYYYMMLSDFQPIFLYEFKLNQNAAKTARKINQIFGNESFNEWLRNFVPEILALKMNPEVVPPTYSNPERGFKGLGGDWPITNGAWDGERTGRQLPCGFWWFKTYWKG